MSTATSSTPGSESGYSYLRHPWPIRVAHWINVIALAILLASGLQIFNAHPALYWGKSSYSGRPPILQMRSETAPDGRDVGITRILGHDFHTTGVLGLSLEDGSASERGFPSWITLPGQQWLSLGRRWHFFFAWVLVINGILYLAYSLRSGHLRRDLQPTRRDWRSFGKSIIDHLRFRHPVGEEARTYNVLQKLAYLAVIFVVLPFVILMGLGMSPRMDSLWPGWVDLVGGRQSARTLHFIGAAALVLFVGVHVFEVIVTGLWNNLRSMITGKYRISGSNASES